MARVPSALCLALFFISAGIAQESTQPRLIRRSSQDSKQTAPDKDQRAVQLKDDESLPEEDESVAPEKFSLDPLESERNIRVGNYYWHKGKYRAAAGRYERATKYNPSSAEAFFKLGEAEEKLKNKEAAKIAFQKVMQVAPDSKLAQDAKKKVGKGY